VSAMVCTRAGCGEAESRINGYCSVYCEDIGALEEELAAAQLELERLRGALAVIADGRWAHPATPDGLRSKHLGAPGARDLARKVLAALQEGSSVTSRRKSWGKRCKPYWCAVAQASFREQPCVHRDCVRNNWWRS
jgi:hypothetical protein